MSNYKQLYKFQKEELLFTEEETRAILKFMFESVDHAIIESLTVTDETIGFAQGLLVEAIDASYAVGYVEAIFRSTTNPAKGALKIIKDFGKRAIRNWFKHATVHDLQDVKIYEFVRVEIARRFRIQLRMLASTASLGKQSGAFLSYNKPAVGLLRAWG
jgi:hypothetical protein